jgi:hypothetical protein
MGGSAPRSTNPAGRGLTYVGITSARPEKTLSSVIYGDMQSFGRELRSIKGVSNVKLGRGRGGWEGGGEKSWIVSYKGDGEARKLLARTGKKHNQDAVLVYEPAGPGKPGSPLFDLDLGTHLHADNRRQVEKLLPSLGIGGWTWFRDKGGNTVLRMVHVPQWSSSSAGQFQAQVAKVKSRLSKAYKVTESHDSVAVDIMENNTGPNGYDSVIGG